PRDLETICLKCLRKEPRQRYAKTADLADDLHRYAQGEPIQARPVSRLERVGRWCRRNPRVAMLLAALALVVLGWTTAVTALWLVAEERRERAQHNYLQAEINAKRAEEQSRQADANFLLARQAVDDYCTKVGRDLRLREKDLERLRKELLQT